MLEVGMERSLCAAVLDKIDEQIERTDHLAALLPQIAVDWTPAIPGAFPAGVLLGHLLECLAGFCAVLYAVRPGQLSHFQDLRGVNHRGPARCYRPSFTSERMDALRIHSRRKRLVQEPQFRLQ